MKLKKDWGGEPAPTFIKPITPYDISRAGSVSKKWYGGVLPDYQSPIFPTWLGNSGHVLAREAYPAIVNRVHVYPVSGFGGNKFLTNTEAIKFLTNTEAIKSKFPPFHHLEKWSSLDIRVSSAALHPQFYALRGMKPSSAVATEVFWGAVYHAAALGRISFPLFSNALAGEILVEGLLASRLGKAFVTNQLKEKVKLFAQLSLEGTLEDHFEELLMFARNNFSGEVFRSRVDDLLLLMSGVVRSAHISDISQIITAAHTLVLGFVARGALESYVARNMIAVHDAVNYHKAALQPLVNHEFGMDTIVSIAEFWRNPALHAHPVFQTSPLTEIAHLLSFASNLSGEFDEFMQDKIAAVSASIAMILINAYINSASRSETDDGEDGENQSGPNQDRNPDVETIIEQLQRGSAMNAREVAQACQNTQAISQGETFPDVSEDNNREPTRGTLAGQLLGWGSLSDAKREMISKVMAMSDVDNDRAPDINELSRSINSAIQPTITSKKTKSRVYDIDIYEARNVGYKSRKGLNALSVRQDALYRSIDDRNQTLSRFQWERELAEYATIREMAHVLSMMADHPVPNGMPLLHGPKMIPTRLWRAVDDMKVFADVTNRESKPEVIILIDHSGSVSTNDLDLPITAAAANLFIGLVEAGLTRVGCFAHTTVKTNLFYEPEDTKDRESVIIRRIASYGMFGYTEHNLARFFESVLCEMANNMDGFAIEYVARRYFTVSKQRKILVVISDGQPNASSYKNSHAVDHTKGVIEKLRKDDITVLSVSVTPYVVSMNDEIYGEEFNIDASTPHRLKHGLRKLLEDIAQ